jgi:hypothetical protein
MLGDLGIFSQNGVAFGASVALRGRLRGSKKCRQERHEDEGFRHCALRLTILLISAQ